jgi:hypothetical protein
LGNQQKHFTIWFPGTQLKVTEWCMWCMWLAVVQNCSSVFSLVSRVESPCSHFFCFMFAAKLLALKSL